jgi:manganese/iron transport system substrate-binding protein
MSTPSCRPLLCLILRIVVVGALTAGPLAQAEEKKCLLVCSTTQVADFVRQVAGDRYEVRSILAPGMDPHLYETKPGDAALVARADLCFENGWHLEGKDWMRRLAENAGRPIVTCVDGLRPLELEEGEGEPVRDPHAWFTPKNASQFVRNITKAMIELDPPHRKEYEARSRLYLDELRVLHHWILSEISSIPAEKRVLVTSHDAFNYFCREYGFTAKTPAGWSTGDEIGGGVTEARRQQTIDAIAKSGVRAIFVETSVNDKQIRTIADQAKVKIGGRLYSDSMGEPGSAGETYLGMMRENVLTIVEGLRE